VRIVLSTWGSFGDLHPYMALGIELKRRGHDARIATIESFRQHVEGAGLGFHPVGPHISPDDPNARDIVRALLDPKIGPEYLFQQVLGPYLRRGYEELLAAVRADGGADLLVTHQIPNTGPIVAEVTGIRWVSGVLVPMSFLSAYDPPTPPQAPGLRRLAAIHPVLAKAFNSLGRSITKSWTAPIYKLREDLGLPRGASPVFEGQHSPILVLALVSDAFAQKQPDYPPQTVITGFAFYDATDQRPPSSELIRFLEAGDPPVLFTLGSAAVWVADDFYQTSIDAVRALGRRALLLVGEDDGKLRAQGLPETIGVFNYAPHSFVMPRASVVVHQGGVGTTAQALRAGRPMLVVPFGQDQPDNARRCVELGVGRTIARKNYRSRTVAAELSRLCSDRSYATRASQVAAVVESEHGVATACDAIERVL
jgi:rhamnosyltransferase subunit B